MAITTTNTKQLQQPARQENALEVIACDRARNEKNRALIACAQSEDEGQAAAALETLVSDNMGLVRSLALRFCGRGCEFEDLIQLGTIGMIKAIRSFELERGTAFSTYAVPLIVGEIRRHLRDDGMIKVSRAYRKLGAQLLRLSNEIMGQEAREPSISELAAGCGVTVEEAAIALDAISPVRSLYDPLPGGGKEESQSYDAIIPDEDSSDELERIKDKLALSQAIAKMQPMWQKIVLLRYYRNHTQQQVADALGLTQVKVSREEKKIVAFLRQELTS